MTKKRVLVAGAAGFIGSHLCDRFLAEGYSVVGMDNLITGNLDNIAHLAGEKNFEFYHHDITKFVHVPGSLDLPRGQKSLQPHKDSTDVVAIIKGVIKAEEDAIAQYNKLIKLCDGVDYVTQDMVIGILGGEEDHRREFIGFLKEYERK